jgi:hypothetical protein
MAKRSGNGKVPRSRKVGGRAQKAAAKRIARGIGHIIRKGPRRN